MALLTYHHISECPPGQEDHRGLFVSPELFRRQLDWLVQAGYIAVTLDQVAAALTGARALPRRWVCLTFDDGFRNNLTEALPALQEAGLTATVFLITDRIGRSTGEQWNDYLTAEDIRQMISAGMHFGSHTHTHPRLTKLDNETALHELVTSRELLQREFALPADWFCYPYGNFSPRIAELVRQAGYRGALSTIRDNRVKPEQFFWMPRVMVMHDTTPERLRYMLSTGYHLVHAWKNRRRWKSIK